jgi:hypothetical protein
VSSQHASSFVLQAFCVFISREVIEPWTVLSYAEEQIPQDRIAHALECPSTPVAIGEHDKFATRSRDGNVYEPDARIATQQRSNIWAPFAIDKIKNDDIGFTPLKLMHRARVNVLPCGSLFPLLADTSPQYPHLRTVGGDDRIGKWHVHLSDYGRCDI